MQGIQIPNRTIYAESVQSPRPYQTLNSTFELLQKQIAEKDPVGAQQSIKKMKTILNSRGFVILPAIRGQLTSVFSSLLSLGNSHDFVDTNYTGKCLRCLNTAFQDLGEHILSSHWEHLIEQATEKLDSQSYWAAQFLSYKLNDISDQTTQKLFDVSFVAVQSEYCDPFYHTLMKDLTQNFADRLDQSQKDKWTAWKKEQAHQAIPAIERDWKRV